MADPQHLSILSAGVVHWNNWRRDNPEIYPDLSWTVLLGLSQEINNFRGINFAGANLEGAVLSGADLTNVDFRRANLSCAKLRCVLASEADFTDANLSRAELTRTDEAPERTPPLPSEPGLVDADFAPIPRAQAHEAGRDISLAVAWDPDILSEADYGELITALGDLVRSEGGAGVRRVVNKLFGVNVEAGVLV
jgi:Pentapeptide repeats (8 copies)